MRGMVGEVCAVSTLPFCVVQPSAIRNQSMVTGARWHVVFNLIRSLALSTGPNEDEGHSDRSLRLTEQPPFPHRRVGQ